MTPSHTVKNGMGYRYYVSRSISASTKASAPNGRRIPAAEIDRLVIDRVRAFLAKEAQVFDAIGMHVSEIAEQQQLIKKAVELAKTWSDLSPAQVHSILRSMIARIDILSAKIDIHLIPAVLCNVLRTGSLDPAIAFPNDTERMTLSVTAVLRRIGKDVRMVIPGPERTACRASPDATLIKLIGKAYQLNERLVAGGMSIREIAGSEGVHRSYIGRLLRLAYLAPDITEAILEGRQPPGLNAKQLLQGVPIPLDWGGQRRALGFA